MKKAILVILSVLALAFSVQAQSVEPFKAGDRVVYIGDSITDGGHYHSYIWLFYATRFPYMPVRMYNGGIGGETAEMIYSRLDGDIFAKNPTYVTLTFGMNDTGYLEYKKEGAEEFGNGRYDWSMEWFNRIVKRFKKLDGVNVAMIGGSPYDNTTTMKSAFGELPGKNEVMQRISEAQKECAEANGWGFVDFNAPMVEVGMKQQESNPEFSLTGGDRVHPDNAGHMVMTYLFLKAQGLGDSKVADIEINAPKSKLEKTENCEVSNLSYDRKQICFDYLAESLPYPMDTISHGNGAPQAAAAAYVPFVEEMNQERLCVKGLPSGNWRLRIDGEDMGLWTAAQWAEGVNLATLVWSPQYRQAQQVMYLNEFRWEIEQNFREYAWMQYDVFQNLGLLDVNDRHAVEVMDSHKASNGWIGWHRPNYARYMHEGVRKARWAEMESLADSMYELAKPVSHKISLTREK